MRRLDWSVLDATERDAALARPSSVADPDVVDAVKRIVEDVRLRGDLAVAEYTERFDGVTPDAVEVPTSDLEAAWTALPDAEKAALEQAKANIEAFHEPQRPTGYSVETMSGVTCRRLPRALHSVGLYVPGGTAPLVSTVLMLAVPATMAGVAERVLVSPPGPDGRINSGVLAAAHLAGVTRVFAIGGAQAIAALAYGTETVPRCAKIFGPGNAYVAAAKAMVSATPDGPAADLPAGPSEAMVVADENANPAFVAADLLSQAEHDTDAQVICVASSDDVADRVQVAIEAQLPKLSRHNIAAASLRSARLFTAPRKEFATIIDAYAPEHLILQIENADDIVGRIRNAGSVFVGPWTPEAVGDYASGTNHTLPTGGAARAYSGVNLESFYTLMTVQELSRDGLRALGPTVETMATMEGLDAHRNAVSLRLES